MRDCNPNAPLPQNQSFLWVILWREDIIICEKDGAHYGLCFLLEFFTMGDEGPGRPFSEKGQSTKLWSMAFLIDECPVTWYQYTLFL